MHPLKKTDGAGVSSYYCLFKDVFTQYGPDGVLGGGDDTEDVLYLIYNVSDAGVINFDSVTETRSITFYKGETWFDEDINDDGNATGSISVSPKQAVLVNGVSLLDDSGAILSNDTEGGLYISDSGTDFKINEDWIEESHSWDQGSHSSTALAVREVLDASGQFDYYQVAVKNTSTWTDWQTNQAQSDEGWQLYAFDKENSVLSINWDKTIWTQAISRYEIDFGLDLDGSGASGDIPGLDLVATDTNGARLKKDLNNVLYIVQNENDNSPQMIMAGQ